MKINFRENYKFWLVLIISIIIILLMNFYEIKTKNFQEIEIILISLLMFVIIIIISMIAIFIYYHKKLTAEKLFWIIIPAMFIMFMFIMPSFKNHDEPFQWFRIQGIANGQILANVSKNEPVAELRRDIYQITTHKPEAINYGYVIQKIINDDSDREPIAKIAIPTTSVYSPIQYMPQILGVVLGRIIYDNAMFMAYIGRLMNIVVSICLLYFALKKMPFGKVGMLVSMCLPIAIEDFTSLSADALTISICYFFIAYVLNIVFDKTKQVNKKDFVILLISSMILALCKIVYLPIVGMILLLSKNKFKTRKTQLISIIIILGVATLLNVLWLKTANSYLELYEDGRSNLQLGVLLQNPVNFIQRVLYTINYYIGDYTFSLFGTELGWNEFAKMNGILPLTMLVLFVFVNLFDDTLKIKLSKYQNIIISLIIVAIIGLIFTSLYIQWNDPENTVIKGIQGRYFIPIIPLLTLFLFSKIKNRSNIKQESICKISGITICISYIYVLIKLLIINI